MIIPILVSLLTFGAAALPASEARAQTPAPAISVSPSPVTVGGTASVSGTGFAPTNWAYVYWQWPDGSTKGVWVYTDQNGDFSTALNFPAGHGTGVEYVAAYDNATMRWTPWTALQVTSAAPGPTLTASPNPAGVGKNGTVQGTGFSPENWVYLRWTRPDGTSGGAWVSTDANGSLVFALGFLQSHGCGTETITAYDNGTGVWSDPFSITVAGC